MILLKGIIIGIGKIIPGVSGSMLAISMGIYDKIIDSINSFFSNYKENYKFLIQLCIGVLIPIVFLSKIIIICLNKYYLITMFLFVGLILGSLKHFKKSISKQNKAISFFFFLLVFIFGVYNKNNAFIINNALLSFLYFIVIGFIDAITMVIPGISGTATLMMLGAYKTLMLSFSNFLNFRESLNGLKILLPFFIGLFIGIIITVKVVSFLLKNYKDNTYSAIMGFSYSTVLLMMIYGFNSNYNLFDLILALIFLAIGYFISKKINHL